MVHLVVMHLERVRVRVIRKERRRTKAGTTVHLVVMHVEVMQVERAIRKARRTKAGTKVHLVVMQVERVMGKARRIRLVPWSTWW